MANVIIPPEHQAAPKGAAELALGLRAAQSAATAAGDGGGLPRDQAYDREMDMAREIPAEQRAKVRAALAEFEKRRLERSPPETVEAALRKYEENLNSEATRGQRWRGQERWQGREQEAARLVNLLHPYQFMARLAAAGVRAAISNPGVDEWVAGQLASHPAGDFEIIGDCGPRLWLNRYVRRGRVGITAWVKPSPGTLAWQRGVYAGQTVTTLQYPWGPEWSLMRFNEYNVPTQEKYRGWRTALLGLIRAEVVTEAQAERAFGPALGPASDFYREQLWKWRNRKAE